MVLSGSAMSSRRRRGRTGSGEYVETGTVTHEGRSFESGGSYFVTNERTGKMEGGVYGDWNGGEVTDWSGKLRIPAKYGQVWTDSFGGKRRTVSFEYKGKKFRGIWYGIDNNQFIRVKEV